MVKRRKIALVYRYDENWIAGAYYIQNLIRALSVLDTREQPELAIICKSKNDYLNLKIATGYRFLKHFNPYRKSLLLRFLLKFKEIVYFKRLIAKSIEEKFRDIDIVFPASIHEMEYCLNKCVFWIPDFQEYYYPSFFSTKEINSRNKERKTISAIGNYLVLSSVSALNDFLKIYPDSNIRTYIIRFAVSGIDRQLQNSSIIGTIPKRPYFICCNQFWLHKNHGVIFDAISILKKRGIDVFVIFTGKENDYRSPDYFSSLMARKERLNIGENVQFLGFIPREYQVQLISNALCILQPSLFEGWSTVIEDAKFLNVNIIASSLDVHKEQLENYPNKILFPPNDALKLAEVMESILFSKGVVSFNYSEYIKQYGKDFVSMVEDICIKNNEV